MNTPNSNIQNSNPKTTNKINFQNLRDLINTEEIQDSQYSTLSTPPIRLIDTREYISALRDAVQDGKEVSMIITGNSMAPFLRHQRDRILFAAPDRPLRTGDIVFYERSSGQFVCHRICRVRPEGFYLIGDNQIVVEGPIEEQQIFARIKKVERKGKWITSGNFWWEFFEKIWIRIIPFRRGITRIVSIGLRIRRRIIK